MTQTNHINKSFKRDLNVGYRNAIALLNMGVCLLERRAYRAAMSTLKDAMTVTKALLVPQAGGGEDGTSSEAAAASSLFAGMVESKLHRATQRLAQRPPSDKTKGNKDCQDHHAISLEAISLEDSFSTFRDVVNTCTTTTNPTQGGEDSMRVSPIRIDAWDADGVDWHGSNNGDSSGQRFSCINSDLICAIALYNLGITYMCMSNDNGNNSSSPPSRVSNGSNPTFNLLFLAKEILFAQTYSTHTAQDGFTTIRLLLVSQVVVNTMIRAMQRQKHRASVGGAPNDNSNDDEIRNLHASLAELKKLSDELNEPVSALEGPCAAGAA